MIVSAGGLQDIFVAVLCKAGLLFTNTLKINTDRMCSFIVQKLDFPGHIFIFFINNPSFTAHFSLEFQSSESDLLDFANVVSFKTKGTNETHSDLHFSEVS